MPNGNIQWQCSESFFEQQTFRTYRPRTLVNALFYVESST